MMDYNNYYPVQTGPPPLPPPTMMNNQPDCSMMSGSITPNSIMHSSPAPSTPQSMRHTPGPPPMQQHHPSMGHHQQPSPHPNYHQLPPHPPISHSASPHPSSTPISQGQPPPRPATGPSPLHQMPQHMNGQSPKIPPSGPMPVQSQPSNLMPPGGPMHPSAIGNNHHHNHQIHHHSGPPLPPPPHGYPSNPMQPHGGHHYGQPPMNHQPPLAPPLMNQGPQPMPNGPMMGGVPPPPPSGYMPAHPGNQERGSPFYQHIPHTEYRIIELNKRLQSRPRGRMPSTPLPEFGSSEEGDWWERFACDFFDNEAILTVRIPGEGKPIEYTIGRTLIPRFFKSYFDGGVTDLSMKLRNIRETQRHPNLTTLECDQADIITKNVFKHPTTGMGMYVVVHTEGHLSLEFVNSFDNLVIKSWRFYVNQCNEYIDRSMTNAGLPYLNEPVTRFGLTKSTCAYLKMCLVMEPMQDLMTHHKQTNLDPRSCLKHLLINRYNIKNVDDKTAPQPKRRKRRAAGEAGATTNKKSKAAANIIGNANAMNNNIGLMADVDTGLHHLPLASQDVLIVGEPSMLGADFGDENERRITRLENNQYDSSTEQQGGQQTSALNDNNQMNQICIPNTGMSQDQQGDMSNHSAQGNGHDSAGNNVQTILGYLPPNSDHTDDNINNQGGIMKNELSEPNHIISNNNNNNGNCLQGNNDMTSAGDTNHQMNSYAMNGETNHIKSEMDLNQTKQSMQPNPIAESEAR